MNFGDIVILIFAICIAINLNCFCYLDEESKWSKKAIPTIVISYFLTLLLYLIFNDYNDLSSLLLAVIMIVPPIIGGFIYHMALKFIKSKGLLFNVIYSSIAIIIIFSLIYLLSKSGYINNNYDESQERLMDRRMMLRN